MTKEIKKLYKSKKDKMIGGVCGGIAEHFNLDPSLVRIIAVLLLIAYGTSVFIYILLWIILPEKAGKK